MEPKQKLSFLKKWGYRFLLLLPALGALGWSVKPSIATFLATVKYQHTSVAESQWNSPGNTEQVRRDIQMHFLKFRQYIPIEDIIIASKASTPEEERIFLLMSKSCGRAKVFVWLPLSIHLPILGKRVWEWCWKPKITIQKNLQS